MCRRILILTLLCLLLSGLTVWAAAVTVTVSPQCEITGDRVYLGDIAVITGDEARAAALSSLNLGSAPGPGRSMVLTDALLGSRLSATGADFSDVVWQVPATIRINARGQQVAYRDIEAVAIQTVTDRLGGNPDDEVSPVAAGRGEDIFAPPGNVSLRAEIPYGIRYNMPTLVQVAVLVDGQPAGKFPVQIRVSSYRNVLVAARPLISGDRLTSEVLRYEHLDIGRLSSGCYTDIATLNGLTAGRNIPAGTVITPSMVEKPVLVKQQSMVAIVVRIGGMEVTAPGLALQNGVQDQMIRVQNINSKKTVMARVVSADTVLVTTYGK